ncbi:MAG TPA: hypothetical protein VHD69_00970 [Candidatus Paceibacterota bacterium]|nr:hypothetical protein [Candidatus Paceibacterota bacterium]
MNASQFNKKVITFCAVALLFLGSLSYFVSVAFHSAGNAQAREDATAEYIDSI